MRFGIIVLGHAMELIDQLRLMNHAHVRGLNLVDGRVHAISNMSGSPDYLT